MNRKHCVFCDEEIYFQFAVPLHYVGWTGEIDDTRRWAHVDCLLESRRSEDQ